MRILVWFWESCYLLTRNIWYVYFCYSNDITQITIQKTLVHINNMIQIAELIWELLCDCEGFLIIIKLHEQRTNVISISWILGISPIYSPGKYCEGFTHLLMKYNIFTYSKWGKVNSPWDRGDWYISNFFCLLTFYAFQNSHNTGIH